MAPNGFAGSRADLAQYFKLTREGLDERMIILEGRKPQLIVHLDLSRGGRSILAPEPHTLFALMVHSVTFVSKTFVQ